MAILLKPKQFQETGLNHSSSFNKGSSMPSPENNPSLVAEALKWVWLGFLAIGGYVWNTLAGQVKSNAEALEDHKKALSNHYMADLKAHEEFITKDDWMEMKRSLYSRFDKLDDKSNKILDRVVLGVSRDEFKGELKDVYASIETLRQTKQGK